MPVQKENNNNNTASRFFYQWKRKELHFYLQFRVRSNEQVSYYLKACTAVPNNTAGAAGGGTDFWEAGARNRQKTCFNSVYKLA